MRLLLLHATRYARSYKAQKTRIQSANSAEKTKGVVARAADSAVQNCPCTLIISLLQTSTNIDGLPYTLIKNFSLATAAKARMRPKQLMLARLKGKPSHPRLATPQGWPPPKVGHPPRLATLINLSDFYV